MARRHRVRLWCRDPAQAQQITHERCNRRYLPEVPLPEDVAVTADFPEALAAVVLEASDRRLVVWRHGKTVEFTDKALDFVRRSLGAQGPRRTASAARRRRASASSAQ